MEFVQRDGHRLVSGGQPFQFKGWNTYYMMVYGAERWARADLESIFDFAATLQMNVLRTWAFNDGAQQWNALQTAPGVFDERIAEGLDWVIAQAASRGMRVMLTLVNYWADYGGVDQYVAWSPSAKTRTDFYRDSTCWSHFSAFCTWLTQRRNTITGLKYCDDPTIFAWELGNELRCPSDLSGQTLTSWMARAASLLKSLAPRQLVASGVEGFFPLSMASHNPPKWRKGEGTHFMDIHQLDDIDLISTHIYPDHWAMDRAQTLAWMDDHLFWSSQLDKPLYFGEFGQRGPRRVARYRQWLGMMHRAMAADELAGHCVWTLYHDDYPDYDAFGLYPRDAALWRQIFNH